MKSVKRSASNAVNLQVRNHIQAAVRGFRKPFTTEELILKLDARYGKTWAAIVRLYGPYGKFAGSHYTSASRVAAVLNSLAVRRQIAKLDYVQASSNWGSPIVRTWKA